MYWTKVFIPTLKDAPQEAETVSHQLMLRAGLIRMLMAGVYSYLPLGYRVLLKIQRIVREEMTAAGASELLLPALQPLDLWVRSGRDKDIGDVMVRFVDRKGRNVCLGPTHEEVITDLVRAYVSSYKQLPVVLFQIQTKFRDELRPRFGLIRGCEFMMKDAYSFDKEESGLDKNYRAMFDAYTSIFKRCGLECYAVEADSGVMGGKVSHEFMVPASNGEDCVLLCRQCHKAFPFHEPAQTACPGCSSALEKISTIEIGHIFKLGIKYSSTLGAEFVDADGKKKPIIMGCYGIGVSRLIPTIIEQNHDNAGIMWPDEVCPFKVIVMPLDVTEPKIREKSVEIYNELSRNNVEVLFDDRDERAGVKFKDADLTGIPYQIIIGKEFINKNTIEIKNRRSGIKTAVSAAEDAMKAIFDFIGVHKQKVC
ncbi:MAG: proline--tRNA ligase [Candidatus Omnitrophica bacterium]|nr:proline--tRNA ligase [Candidatus Omnitrophota bacterium]